MNYIYFKNLNTPAIYKQLGAASTESSAQIYSKKSHLLGLTNSKSPIYKHQINTESELLISSDYRDVKKYIEHILNDKDISTVVSNFFLLIVDPSSSITEENLNIYIILLHLLGYNLQDIMKLLKIDIRTITESIRIIVAEFKEFYQTQDYYDPNMLSLAIQGSIIKQSTHSKKPSLASCYIQLITKRDILLPAQYLTIDGDGNCYFNAISYLLTSDNTETDGNITGDQLELAGMIRSYLVRFYIYILNNFFNQNYEYKKPDESFSVFYDIKDREARKDTSKYSGIEDYDSLMKILETPYLVVSYYTNLSFVVLNLLKFNIDSNTLTTDELDKYRFLNQVILPLIDTQPVFNNLKTLLDIVIWYFCLTTFIIDPDNFSILISRVEDTGSDDADHNTIIASIVESIITDTFDISRYIRALLLCIAYSCYQLVKTSVSSDFDFLSSLPTILSDSSHTGIFNELLDKLINSIREFSGGCSYSILPIQFRLSQYGGTTPDISIKKQNYINLLDEIKKYVAILLSLLIGGTSIVDYDKNVADYDDRRLFDLLIALYFANHITIQDLESFYYRIIKFYRLLNYCLLIYKFKTNYRKNPQILIAYPSNMTFKDFCVAFSSYIYTILYLNLLLLNANGTYNIPILDGSNSKYLVKLAKIPGITIFKREYIRNNTNFIGLYTVDSADAEIDYPSEPLDYNNLDFRYNGFLHLLRVDMHYNAFYYKSSLTAEQKASIKESIKTYTYNGVLLNQIPILVRLSTFKKFYISDLDSQINSNIQRAETLVNSEFEQYTSIFNPELLKSPSPSTPSSSPLPSGISQHSIYSSDEDEDDCDSEEVVYKMFCKEFRTIKTIITPLLSKKTVFQLTNPDIHREIMDAITKTDTPISEYLKKQMLEDNENASIICDIFLLYLIHLSANYSSFAKKLDKITEKVRDECVLKNKEFRTSEFYHRIIVHIRDIPGQDKTLLLHDLKEDVKYQLEHFNSTQKFNIFP